MRSIIVLALSSLLLAGCVTPESPGEAVEAAAVEESAEAVPPTTAVENATVALVPRVIEVAYEGTTGTWLCAPSGVNSCMGPPVPSPAPSDNTFYEPELGAAPVALEIVLTWESSSPVSAEMTLSAFAVRSCGEGCREFGGDLFSARVAGTSPLTLSATDIAIGPEETLAIHIGLNEPNPSMDPIFAAYSVDQPFSVAGSITTLVPAP